MDTIKHVVEAAENYLWGNDEASNTPSREEPVAGVQGKGTAADPYDAGNAPKNVALEHAKESAEQVKNEKDEGRRAVQERENQGTIPGGFVPGSGSSTTPAGGQARKTEPSKTEPDIAVKNPPAAASGALKTNTRSETTSMPTPSPATLETPATSINPPTAAVLPRDTHPPPPLQASAAEASGGRGSSKGSKQHTAAMGAAPAAPMVPPPAGPVSSPQKTNAASDRGQPQAQNPPPEEHRVPSTGYAAEGGDFDAAEPGAGKKADRLLAEHDQEVSHGKKRQGKEPNPRSQQSQPPSVPQHERNAGSGGGSSQNKTPSQHHSIPHPSLSHLKEKLHKGSKHHS